MKLDNNSNLILENVTEMNIPYLGDVFLDKNLEESIGKTNKLIQTSFMKELNASLQKINL